jgi:hypothetical protein
VEASASQEASHKGAVAAMSVFKCLDDPKDGPFLKVHGITEKHLIKFIVDRSNGVTKEDALATLVKGRTATEHDADVIRRIVEEFPIA